ncbi:hypothetical protein KEM48_014627, partial [Puccinia striiformis f. sp. tritici PST-130]
NARATPKPTGRRRRAVCIGLGRCAAADDGGFRPSLGDRPISHAEWHTSTASRALPVGPRRAKNTSMTIPATVSQVTGSRRRNSARPGHRRRARPVAGAKPRDDGLRVASRLPPRSRLGAVTNRASGGAERAGGPAPTSGAAPAALSAALVTRVTSVGRPWAAPSAHSYHTTRTAVGRTPGPQRSRPCDRPRVGSPLRGRTALGTHARPGTDGAERVRVTRGSAGAPSTGPRGGAIKKPRSLVDPASSPYACLKD